MRFLQTIFVGLVYLLIFFSIMDEKHVIQQPEE
jgi:hypothetical protein